MCSCSSVISSYQPRALFLFLYSVFLFSPVYLVCIFVWYKINDLFIYYLMSTQINLQRVRRVPNDRPRHERLLSIDDLLFGAVPNGLLFQRFAFLVSAGPWPRESKETNEAIIVVSAIYEIKLQLYSTLNFHDIVKSRTDFAHALNVHFTESDWETDNLKVKMSWRH